jgi:transmembrane sensor
MDTELLQKYISGNANNEEMRLITEWIQQSDENKREYMAQRKLFDISLWRTQPVEIAKKKNSKVFSLKTVALEVIKIAAIIALVFSGTYYWMGKQQSVKTEQMQSIYAPAGQRSVILLSDGTKVWLNARSKLTFPGTFDGNYRKVKLDGEGYFIVTKNKKKPFIVETNKYDVKVLGTEFNVIAYASNIMWTTSLLKGSVEIYAPHGSEKIKLEPNTMAIYKDNHLVKSVIEDTEYFRWREGLICFNDVSIKEMINKLKLYYGVDILVKNTKILCNRYTGKFWIGDGIEHVFKVLRLDNKFTYKKDDDKNLIIIN